MRRQIIGGLGAVAALGLMHSSPARATCRDGSARAPRDVLVNIFLRGGADALSLVVPYGDTGYYDAREGFGVSYPRPDSGLDNAALAVPQSQYFGFHPALGSLIRTSSGPWQQGHMACILGSGAREGSRSHFENQDRLEYATGGTKGDRGGWLARYLELVDSPAMPDPLFRAVALQSSRPQSLAGHVGALTAPSLAGLTLGAKQDPAYLPALRDLYALKGDAPDGRFMIQARSVINLLDSLDGCDWNQPPADGAQYPTTGLGPQLKATAQLIKAFPETEVVCLDRGGWDTHSDQAERLDVLVRELGGALLAFYQDLSHTSGRANIANVTVLVHSEFGRRLSGNASAGTDHGTGGLTLAIGGGVRGGFYHPGWTATEGSLMEQMVFRGDLDVSVDYRRILGQVLQQRMGFAGDWHSMFPNYGWQPAGFDFVRPR